MSGKLFFPEIPQKSIEHEKWNAMVDSVIEFISASRTMLHVLNERIKNEQKLFYENNGKVEEETVKLQFYEEIINSHVTPDEKLKSPLTASTPNLDNGEKNTEDEKEQHALNNSELSGRNSKRPGRKFVSRIPRTKSCVEDRTKCKTLSMERTHNEGSNIGKPQRSRKATEIGYSIIHQRSKTPKGDGNFRF